MGRGHQKAKIKFSIGYNHASDFLDRIDKYKQYIGSIYFPAPRRIVRSSRNFLQEDRYDVTIAELIGYCLKSGIRSKLLVNASCDGGKYNDSLHFSKLLKYLRKLHDAGLSTVVVTNPLFVDKIRSKLPKLEIEASVVCNIKTLTQARYCQTIGISAICIDADANYNMELIKGIKSETKLKIILMVNEGCLYNCIGRNHHLNFISHAAPGVELAESFCKKIFKKQPQAFFKSPFVRPEDIHNYFQIVDEFKLVTRSMPTTKIELILNAYIQQSYGGNLLELVDCSYSKDVIKWIDNLKLNQYDFFNKIRNCNERCANCGFCKRLLYEVCELTKAR